jgi:CSLREA domain-containing protein
MLSARARRGLVVLAVIALPITLATGLARAGTTITVNTTNDTYGPSDSNCSLRDAVHAVDTQTAFGACPAGTGGDTIVLPAGPAYTLSIAPTGPDDNATGDLNITRSVTIEGGGAATTTIDAAHIDRIFNIMVPGVTVTITGLTLTNGQAPSGTVGTSGSSPGLGGHGGEGGAVFNAGTLTLKGVTISNSRAGPGGAGGNNTGAGAGASGGHGGNGGAVSSSGDLTLESPVRMTDDRAGAGGAPGTGTPGGTGGDGGFGGAIHEQTGTLTVDGASFTDDTSGAGTAGGTGGTGGAIDSEQQLTITNSTFTGNAGGAGATGTTSMSFAGGGSGGAISSFGPANISDSTFTDNVSGVAGVAGALASQQPSGLGGAIFADVDLTLRRDAFSTNSTAAGTAATLGGSSGTGGAVDVRGALTVDASTFTMNSTGPGAAGTGALGGAGGIGGAIFASQGGTVTNSTFGSNSTGAGAAAAAVNGTGGSGGDGGAIASDNALTVVRSTFNGNTVGAGGTGQTGAGMPGSGAALWVAQGAGSSLVNDTLTGNGSPTINSGAAAFFTGTTTVTVEAVTVANNQTPGIDHGGTLLVTLVDTLLSANSGSNCAGTVADGGHNLSFPASDMSCPATFAHGDPRLAAALASNGGSTETLSLGAGSAAIDAGPATTGASCPTTDQRGMPRPQGGACDIGAFERATPSISISSPANGATYTKGQAVTASYSCAEGGQTSFISTCSGTAPSGSAIHTSTVGRGVFKVSATDVAGAQATKIVTYTVAPPTHLLTLTFNGDGGGTVTAVGLRCSKSCSHAFAAGTPLTLTASASKGSAFSGFSGACHGAKPCKLTMSSDQSVNVTFTIKPPHTTITKHAIGSTTAKFSFKGLGGVGKLRFKCRLDRRRFRPCRSPVTYSGLTPGSHHTFAVEAIDSRGKADPRPARLAFALSRRSR